MFADLSLSVKFKAIAGKVDQGAGLGLPLLLLNPAKVSVTAS